MSNTLVSNPPPKFLTGIIRIIILIGLLAPIGIALYKQWTGVQASLTSINWSNLVQGSIVQLAGLPLMGVISWIILRSLSSQQPYFRVTGIYFISQLAKYLPGGIWAFPGRAVAYQSVGVDKVASVLSVIREVITLFLGAAVIGLLGLVQGLPFSDWIYITTVLGIFICVLLIILTQIPSFWKSLRRVKYLKAINLSILETGQAQFNFRWIGYALASSVIYWLITGIGFSYIVKSVTLSGESLTWFQSASIFSLAWCAGFVIILAPAGIGIRESAISLLLSQSIPVSEALTVAIIARLWWTMTEAIYIIISLAWFSGKANRFILTRIQSFQQNPSSNDSNNLS